jgi:5'-3' exonuclease
MGIKQLMTVINEKARKAVRKVHLSQYAGKVIACDASMAMYQFLMATQNGAHYGRMTDESGNPTSHLAGMYYRTVLFLENGIKPIWVFDGKAPDLKVQELKKRKNFKVQAQEKIKAAFKETEEENKGEEEEEVDEEEEKVTEEKAKKGKKAKKSEEKAQKSKEEEITQEEKPKKKRKLTNRQWQVIQKKRYGAELEQIEEGFRTRISNLSGALLSTLSGEDYMCCGESDAEEITVTRELEQIISSLEHSGFRNFHTENMGEVQKNMKRTTIITTDMVEDVKEMLIHLGVPVIVAPAEAEAQCAELVKAGKAYAVASEDMDALAFGSSFLLRGFSNAKEPVIEVNLTQVLEFLDFSYVEFVDFCILLGCDYCKTIGGVGAAKAYALLKQCSQIENVIEYIASNPKLKYEVPEFFPFNEARKLFLKPKVLNCKELELCWTQPMEEQIKDFLVGVKGFGLTRVENSLKRLKKNSIGCQQKIENYFGIPVKRESGGVQAAKVKKTKI